MRTLRVVILSAAVMLLLIQLSVAKNGNIGIYGIVDKVVFEPDGSSPERPQIWGLFVVPVPISSGLYKAPQRGFCTGWRTQAIRKATLIPHWWFMYTRM